MTPPITVQQNTSPMMATTNAAMPRPFLGAKGPGLYPA
jgi:hypothetical protein